MNTPAFTLDPQLAHDTHAVAELPLCDVRLMGDVRFVWLVLVPRRADVVEIVDLAEADQQQLWHEVNQCAAALRGMTPCDKLNIGALGNVVRQLHVHVIARVTGDSAWPNAVWGWRGRIGYEASLRDRRVAALRAGLGA